MILKQKKKLDPRVRFEHPTFKRELKKVKNYKRKPGAITRLFSPRLGNLVTSWPWRLLAPIFIGVVLAFYILFVPNFLFVKSVNIEGVSGQLADDLSKQVLNYLDHNRLRLIPQRNLLFLQEDQLASFITATNPHIYKVTRVNKKFFSSVNIAVVPRIELYKLEVSNGKFVVANDGTVLSGFNSTGQNLLLVSYPTGSDAQVGVRYFAEEFMAKLATLLQNFKDLSNMEVELVAIVPVLSNVEEQVKSDGQTNNLPPEEIVLYSKSDKTIPGSGVKVIFSVNDDVSDALNKLHLILSQQTSERLKLLAYIDMRFKNLGFICLINTLCSDNINKLTNPQPDTVESMLEVEKKEDTIKAN